MNPQQASLLEPVAHARHGDPDTSHLAAASVSNLTVVQGRILDLLAATGPMDDESLVICYQDIWQDATAQSIRSRRAELVAKQLVRFAGSYSRTVTGRKSREWTLA